MSFKDADVSEWGNKALFSLPHEYIVNNAHEEVSAPRNDGDRGVEEEGLIQDPNTFSIDHPTSPERVVQGLPKGSEVFGNERERVAYDSASAIEYAIKWTTIPIQQGISQGLVEPYFGPDNGMVTRGNAAGGDAFRNQAEGYRHHGGDCHGEGPSHEWPAHTNHCGSSTHETGSTGSRPEWCSEGTWNSYLNREESGS